MGYAINKIGVIGAGAWGTTIADYLCQLYAAPKDLRVRLYTRDPGLEASIRDQGINPKTHFRYLDGRVEKYDLHQKLREGVTSSLDEAIEEAEAIFIAVPAAAYREVIQELRGTGKMKNGVIIINGTKGFEYESQDNRLRRMSEIVKAELHPRDYHYVACSGPNLSPEIRRKEPTASVVASHDRGAKMRVQQLLHSERMRIYTSDDVAGVEAGGAVKNPIALAVGMYDGYKDTHHPEWTGKNTKSTLMSRGHQEIIRIGKHLGARSETFTGLAGAADLTCTCLSTDSRNYLAGYSMGRGLSKDEALGRLHGQIAQGIDTTEILYQFVKEHQQLNLDMIPIIEQVYRVINGETTVDEAVTTLTTRPPRKEFW
jgi:glycerol-3-phosphate dehydrogenase (NAD(P)+)